MKLLRKILFPFSLLYGAIIFARNKMFDLGWISSKSYNFPLICVGNLSVGGTGKSPMVEYLIRLLNEDNPVATLSRGYKRNTKGFHLVQVGESSAEAGDEPLQFKTKFPEIMVAVDEDRQEGISKLRKLRPSPEVIILDDAFQHRKVVAGLYILLTAYSDLYVDDHLLPTGNLRENRAGSERADIVVVTKCPATISVGERKKIVEKMNLAKTQSLYFSCIEYDEYVTNGTSQKKLTDLPPFVLVTGIANPSPLVAFLSTKKLNFQHVAFPDHHRFSEKEIRELRRHPLILSTEKDYMRLKNELSAKQLFYLPIETKFLKEGSEFDKEIVDFVKKFPGTP